MNVTSGAASGASTHIAVAWNERERSDPSGAASSAHSANQTEHARAPWRSHRTRCRDSANHEVAIMPAKYGDRNGYLPPAVTAREQKNAAWAATCTTSREAPRRGERSIVSASTRVTNARSAAATPVC